MSSLDRLSTFAPALRVRLEAGNYVIRTAESLDDVRQALRLRYDVFYREHLDRTNPERLDVDRFDGLCDHMLVAEAGTGQVVGTYRLNASATSDFYSRQEFDIGPILDLEGAKLEIGRGCVARRHRQRAVFMLLWRGIAEYMSRAGTKYLFGCLSMPATTDVAGVAALSRYLLRAHGSAAERRVSPLNPVPGLADPAVGGRGEDAVDDAAVRRALPLLPIYLHAGAVVCGEPAYDEEFQFYDFFTLLDVAAVTSAGNRLFRTADHGAFESVRSFLGA